MSVNHPITQLKSPENNSLYQKRKGSMNSTRKLAAIVPEECLTSIGSPRQEYEERASAIQEELDY